MKSSRRNDDYDEGYNDGFEEGRTEGVTEGIKKGQRRAERSEQASPQTTTIVIERDGMSKLVSILGVIALIISIVLGGYAIVRLAQLESNLSSIRGSDR